MGNLRTRQNAHRARLLGLAAAGALLLTLIAAPAGAGIGITISGTAFSDTNGNGALDAGEPGIAGVIIQVDFGADGTIDATGPTDGSGNYSGTAFSGPVRVRSVAPAGMFQTSLNPPDLSGPSAGVNFGFAPIPSVLAVPTLDTWGIAILVLLCAALALRHLHRRAATQRKR